MSSIEVRDPTPQSLRGAAAEESNVEESNVEGSNSEEQAKEEAKSLLRDFEPPRYVSRKAINYKKALQRLQLATGTDVTIFADFRLTKAEMFKVAEHVIGMTKGKVITLLTKVAKTINAVRTMLTVIFLAVSRMLVREDLDP